MSSHDIILLPLLLHSPACSDRSTSPSIQQGTSAATEPNPVTEPGGEELPPESYNTSTSSAADGESEEGAMTLCRETQEMMKARTCWAG